MSNEKAIKTLDSMLIGNENVEIFNAIQIAISALEKQVAKKMKINPDGMPDYKCPSCRKIFCSELWENIPYCCRCGQKIDWSEWKDE